MSSAVNSSLIPSASRPLRLRLRPDLEVREQTYQGRRFWVVKDPLTLKYFRFEEEEYALLTWLDGRQSLDGLQSRFESRFAPQKISLQEIHQFVGAMHKASLVLSDASDQGRALIKRSRESKRRERAGALANVLCIRFQGFDPDRLLTWLNTRIGWLFSAPAVAFCCLLAVVAALSMLTNFEAFQAHLPAFHEFFAARNWVWLAATLAITKVLHEFGHGLACKRFGGECHEMGVMLLVLTPCLYCNVSDSWMLPNKWKRAAIGAAGMYVEIILASVCTLIWWNTRPGMLNYLCLNVMFVSSVSTILFNANPLMRYDGYYILSDLLEIPNLRQKAASILHRTVALYCLGLPQAEDPFLPARGRFLFATYSIAAFVYRWIVVLSILWFLNSVLEPFGLKPLGQVVAGVSLYGLIVQPLIAAYRRLTAPGRMDQVNRLRFTMTMVALVTLLVSAVWIPTPHYIRCYLHVRPRDASPVYVEVGGELIKPHVEPGQRIRAGDPIVTLANHQLDYELNELEGRRAQLEAQAAAANERALLGESAAALEWEELLKSIESVERQIERQKADQQRLTVRSEVDGVVLAVPYRERVRHDDRLGGWSGRPISDTNVGAQYPFGQLVCHVGDPGKLQAILFIEQDAMEFVHEGQTVDVVLSQHPGRRMRTRLAHISKKPAQRAPNSLIGAYGGPIPGHPAADGGGGETQATYFQAAAFLNDVSHDTIVGATGRARIRVGWRTVGQRLVRYVQQLLM